MNACKKFPHPLCSLLEKTTESTIQKASSTELESIDQKVSNTTLKKNANKNESQTFQAVRTTSENDSSKKWKLEEAAPTMSLSIKIQKDKKSKDRKLHPRNQEKRFHWFQGKKNHNWHRHIKGINPGYGAAFHEDISIRITI